jgi:hypothetical protein
MAPNHPTMPVILQMGPEMGAGEDWAGWRDAAWAGIAAVEVTTRAIADVVASLISVFFTIEERAVLRRGHASSAAGARDASCPAAQVGDQLDQISKIATALKRRRETVAIFEI